MSSIGTPVFRPTADCIWNSFRSSGKRHLLLTGGRKTGKTTLLTQLFPTPLPGVTTWAQPGQAAYLLDNLTREQVQIGVYDPSLPSTENRMRPHPEGFTGLGLRALERAAQADSRWVCVDEIGYLESDCTPYRQAIRSLMTEKQVVAVLRKQPLPFLLELCSRSDVFTVDLDAPYGSCSCVIMASGLGKRFGGNKLMANFLGEPMICRALAATDGIFDHRVVVTRYREVARLCQTMGVEAVLHDLPHRSDTVRLGLEAVGSTERCLFCPGDQPLLRRETVAALALASKNENGAIWRTAFEGIHGSPTLFPVWTFPELMSLPAGKGGGHVFRQYPRQLRTLEIQNRCELMDVDTRDDLEFLLSGQIPD